MSEAKKSFVVFRENPSIFVIRFSPLNRESCNAWREYSLKFNGQFPDPLRVLYDFTDCTEMPSPYVLSVMRQLIPQLIMPKNTRNAYLVPNQSYYVWANVFFSTKIERGKGISFFKREEAIAWLMEDLGTSEEAPEVSQDENAS